MWRIKVEKEAISMGHLICKCRTCLRAYVMLANARTDLACPHEVLPIVLNYSKSTYSSGIPKPYTQLLGRSFSYI